MRQFGRIGSAFRALIASANLLALLGLALFVVIEWPAIRESRKVNRETLSEIAEARAEREQEAIARAWQTVTTRSAGNSGKREALQLLVERDIPLAGIDLSCDTMGGGWTSGPEEYGPPTLDIEQREVMGAPSCDRPTYLRDVILTGANLEGANLSGTDLTGAKLNEAILAGANLEGALLDATDFSETDLYRANLRGARADGTTFNRAKMRDVDASGAWIRSASFDEAYLERADFTGSRIGNSTFYKADATLAMFRYSLMTRVSFKETNVTLANFSETVGANPDGMWAYNALGSDGPGEPKGLPEGVRIVHRE